MMQSIRGMAKAAIVGIAVFAGTVTYGQYSESSSQKSLTSFCGFKRGEPKKKGAEVTKARAPFRKFRNVRLSYSEKERLCAVDAFALLKGNALALKKEIEACCKEIERQGVVFRGLSEMDDGFESRGSDWFSKAEVIVHGEVKGGEKNSSMSIYVGWSCVDEDPVDVDVALRLLKRSKDIKAFIETLAGEKFGSGVPENPSELVAMQLKVSKNTFYSKGRVFSKPLWGMNGDVTLCFGEGDKKLNAMIMERRDSNVREWAEIRTDFNKLSKQIETTLGITLSTPEEKDSSMPVAMMDGKDLSVKSKSLSSCFENDDLRIIVEATLDRKFPGEKESRPATFHFKIVDKTLSAK